MSDGSIVWYFLSRDVDVGITCDGDDSWKSWESDMELDSSCSYFHNRERRHKKRIE